MARRAGKAGNKSETIGSAAEYVEKSVDLKKQAETGELERLEQLFSPLPDNERTFLQPLLENAAFMRATLDELQTQIRVSGAVDEYQNGANQHGVKISAAIQAYNQMMKTYHTLMDKLLSKLPAEAGDRDELDEFRI